MNIACIYREQQFSPNMVDKDAAILDAVAHLLVDAGHRVSPDIHSAQMVFSMARSSAMLDRLRDAEGRGVRVVNSTASIANCRRDRFTSLFLQNDVLMPKSVVCDVLDCHSHSESIIPIMDVCRQGKSLWVKRGDGYSERPDDVVFCTNETETMTAIAAMKARGISSVVVSAHADGDLIKFYGVRGTGFFRWYYAAEGHSKFGLEAVNGNHKGYSFDTSLLWQTCENAADVLGLDVYGGDVVVGTDGSLSIIDFNDWPSFSRFRDDAAMAIASLVTLKTS